ncbi:SDR family oxidoreductase [Lacisediminihabitans profunda]|uniref:SDR family oxidoreductase n=1 Tax=Lacisediminihabitans profunda TaxID=2594790 RepID=A0A5C8UIY9_9MICO|nr:SDR family oxidoreductase [Lacisediminihabitans profunda]TXN28126.1 SDR family oxidoreductase [Lacisediminihabitans profunda]
MILVVGGTGTLGRPLMARLAARGVPLRVLTRDSGHAAALRATGVEAVEGDVRDPAAVTAAVNGCDTVISAIHGFASGRGISPAAIDRDANISLVRAAVDANVDHMILVSAYGASASHPMSLHRMKFAAEQALQASGLHWTIIRPTAFLETWTKLIGAKLPTGGAARVFGRGDNPINFVAVTEVASALDRAVFDEGWRGRSVDVVGTDSITLNQLAERLTAAAGSSSRTDHVPLLALRALSILARPVAPAFARMAHAAVEMDTSNMEVDGPAPAAK